MTNIFLNSYEQRENKLTYNFLALLEHLDVRLATEILVPSGIPPGFERLRIENFVYSGGKANPDGCFLLDRPGSSLTVFFENKTPRRPLDIEQIRRHIRVRLNDSPDRRLLVITADGEDRKELAALGDSRIHFLTWHQIAASAERLAREATDSKDQFLLRRL